MVSFSKYPGQIDDSTTLPVVTDGITPINAVVVNRLRDAILAVEGELGISPSHEFGSLRARLDNMQSVITTLTNITDGTIEILQNGSVVLAKARSLDFTGNVNVSVSQALRAQIEILGGGGSITIQESGVTVDSDTTLIDFFTGFNVTSLSPGQVRISLEPLEGDLSGTLPNPTVSKINGTTVNTTSSSDVGKVLKVSAAGVSAWSSPNTLGLILGISRGTILGM